MQLGQTIKKDNGWYIQCSGLVGPFPTEEEAIEMFEEWFFEAMAS